MWFGWEEEDEGEEEGEWSEGKQCIGERERGDRKEREGDVLDSTLACAQMLFEICTQIMPSAQKLYTYTLLFLLMQTLGWGGGYLQDKQTHAAKKYGMLTATKLKTVLQVEVHILYKTNRLMQQKIMACWLQQSLRLSCRIKYTSSTRQTDSCSKKLWHADCNKT